MTNKRNKLLLVITIGLSLLHLSVSAENNVVSEQVCNLHVDFEGKPRTKTQAINLSADVQMAVINKVNIKKRQKVNIATNVTCQQLMGANYTGSKAEWAKFFDSAIKGLQKSAFTGLEFTLIGDNDKVINDELSSSYDTKEYNFVGDLSTNKQIIKNLAILDKTKNTLYTFSVSGNEIVETDISEEFSRLVNSIKAVK